MLLPSMLGCMAMWLFFQSLTTEQNNVRLFFKTVFPMFIGLVREVWRKNTQVLVVRTPAIERYSYFRRHTIKPHSLMAM